MGPENLSEAERSILVNGRKFVPGVCFKHKKFDYRGVIIGYDPWCTYPTAWRARWVPNRPHGEAQPFYYCVVDERDRPGQQSRYVAEENIELCEFVYPVEARLASALLLPCNLLGGYLPSAHLKQALEGQRA